METEITIPKKSKLQYATFLRLVNALIRMVNIRDVAALSSYEQILVKNYHYRIRKNEIFRFEENFLSDKILIEIIIKELHILEKNGMIKTANYAFIDQLIEGIIPEESLYIQKETIELLESLKEYFKIIL